MYQHALARLLKLSSKKLNFNIRNSLRINYKGERILISYNYACELCLQISDYKFLTRNPYKNPL